MYWFLTVILMSTLVLLQTMGKEIPLEELKVRPPRPDQFRNPMELQKYLKNLRDYYSVLGRPR